MKSYQKTALKTNPFTTYRDPVTGRWTVIKSTPSKVKAMTAS